MPVNNPYTAYQKQAQFARNNTMDKLQEKENIKQDVLLDLSSSLAQNLGKGLPASGLSPVNQLQSQASSGNSDDKYENESLAGKQFENRENDGDNNIDMPEMIPANAGSEQTGSQVVKQQARPVDKYLENAVMAAAPEELTLMLYDGAIKFMNQSIIYLDSNDTEKAHQALIKTQDIFSEFMITLNMDYEVSDNLMQMYAVIKDNLFYANLKKDKELIMEMISLARELRDTWAEVIKLARGK
jgi:flagellar protein FliS